MKRQALVHAGPAEEKSSSQSAMHGRLLGVHKPQRYTSSATAAAVSRQNGLHKCALSDRMRKGQMVKKKVGASRNFL